MITTSETLVGVATFNGPALEILSLFDRYTTNAYHVVNDVTGVSVWSQGAPCVVITARKGRETVSLFVPVASPSGLTPWINVYTY
jgi:hypothetical protein